MRFFRKLFRKKELKIIEEIKRYHMRVGDIVFIKIHPQFDNYFPRIQKDLFNLSKELMITIVPYRGELDDFVVIRKKDIDNLEDIL